jgi:hypothetical protein
MSLKFWRSQRGQSTAMVIVMLWAFILVVGMVANVGQAVNRRIALQTVADAGAFTGATVMAEGLNYIAYANWWIQNWWATIMAPGFALWVASVFDCEVAQSTIDAYHNLRRPFDFAITSVLNPVYSIYPYGEARRISEMNVAELFRSEEGFLYRELNLDPETGVVACATGLCRDALRLMEIEQVPDGTMPEDPWIPFLNLIPSRRSFATPCKTHIGPIPVPTFRVFRFDVWYRRSSRDPRFFAFVVTAPPTKAFMFDSFFGPIPSMTAAAAARPVGGSIEKGQARYVAKMVPLSKVMPANAPCPDGQGSCGLVIDPSAPEPRFVSY